MKLRSVLCFCLMLGLFFANTGEGLSQPVSPGQDSQQRPSSVDLVWDSLRKKVNVAAGEVEASLHFSFTNAIGSATVIRNVMASCGCTTLRLPPMPWEVAPGTNGQISFSINVTGKSGTLFKTVTVVTDKGSHVLGVDVVILPPEPQPAIQPETAKPPELSSTSTAIASVLMAGKFNPLPAKHKVQNPPAMLNPNRGRNFQMAAADRQAVFKGDCVRCHVEPGKEKFGKALFDASCGICHNSPNRATMVPDLMTLKVPTDADFWRTSITYGKPGSLMPAFASDEGGPLTREQIESLVKYLADTVISQPNVYE